MLRQAVAATILAASLLCGCATSNAPSGFHRGASGQLVENMPAVQTDKFSPQITVVGLSDFENPFGGIAKKWFIRSFIDKTTGDVSNQLYVWITYAGGGWNFFDAASDDTASPHAVDVVDRSVDNCGEILCSYTEDIVIDLPSSLLASRPNGFEMKVSARSGASIILNVSREMVLKQLKVIAENIPPKA